MSNSKPGREAKANKPREKSPDVESFFSAAAAVVEVWGAAPPPGLAQNCVPCRASGPYFISLDSSQAKNQGRRGIEELLPTTKFMRAFTTKHVRNRSVGRRLIKAPEEEHWQVETERGAREPAGPPIKERERELFSFAISALVRLLPWPCKRPSRARAQTQSANVRSGTRVNPERAEEELVQANEQWSPLSLGRIWQPSSKRRERSRRRRPTWRGGCVKVGKLRSNGKWKAGGRDHLIPSSSLIPPALVLLQVS